ncbi:XRE family transcriptional regulator [Dysgonomonas sp. 521]|uniref:helix-turn-helix domain-containing protein n=1 Tax=Dysgonomonas sp. 521 TaxID=2302932 RepID=UPI0013D20713|nr:helix-turn-helix transcriptional regulator [Dysgonomonas sp. 521]NDV97602.1 XRE family transcriptional regulator [Dysgonomonas sp. 521]
MKANNESNIHLGNNIKHLMRAFQITQVQLADKLDMPDSHLCNLLQKADIDDSMLQKIADAIGYGVTADMLKAYSHDDTVNYIINNYTQNVEEGGSGTLIPNQNYTQNVDEGGSGTLIPNQNYTQTVDEGGSGTLIPNQDNSTNSNSTFQEGSSQNNYTTEKAFEYAETISELKTEIMRLRMKYEPDKVEEELKNKK